MAQKPIYFSVKSHPENLIHIREMIARCASENQIPEDISGQVVLAVDEACSNIIRHSYENDHTRNIDLRLELSQKALTIVISDKGAEFDQESVEKRDINDVKPGGLGLYIISQVMDSVERTRTKDGCNCLTLVKKL